MQSRRRRARPLIGYKESRAEPPHSLPVFLPTIVHVACHHESGVALQRDATRDFSGFSSSVPLCVFALNSLSFHCQRNAATPTCGLHLTARLRVL